jgi:hydroxymethylglutaryl-CoA lyase
MTALADRVEIIEVGPRDGLQDQDVTLSVDDRMALIGRLIDAGARRIEVASFVNAARVPQMADAEALIAALPPRKDVRTIGLVLNERGLERALATAIDEIGIVAVASDSFGLRNQKQTARESVDMAVGVIQRARVAGRAVNVTIGVAFGCPFEGEIAPSQVVDFAVRLAEAGPHEIALADTVGVAVPRQVRDLLSAVRRAIPQMPLRCHFHNTRNQGFANAYAALEEGVRRFDSSIGGIGGCPFAPAATGNIGTEDLVYLLERSGFETGFDTEKLRAIAPWLADRLELAELPAMASKAPPFPPAARS